MNADLLQGFYLGDFLIEPARGRVTGRVGSGHLPPKAMEVLLCLANDAGELVTRESLLKQVWGAGKGSSEALSHAVSEVRQALNDHADDPLFVQTLPRRGYRLLQVPVPAGDDTATVVIGAGGGARASDIGILEKLNRRGVLETGIAYLIVGWLLIQIADIVFGQLHLPAWLATFVTALVIAGFPIALVLSWYLEFRDGRAVVHKLSAADARRQKFSRTYMSVIGALALAGVVVFAYDSYFGLPDAPDTPMADVISLPPVVPNSFAVLPFFNLDGSEQTEIFSNGLVDDVRTRLTRVPGLKVASRGDSHSLEPNTASQRVRERLRVEMYLEGSVEIANDQIRVIVQLIDSETGYHVMSRAFDKPLEGFFDIRDEITSLTVSNVRVALPADTQSSSLQSADRPPIDAYELYRHGVDASREPMSIDTVNKALQWYDSALEVDPDYAAAHAGKCDIYVYAYREADDAAFIDRAESSCATALQLNPNLDVVHTSLGKLYTSTGHYAEAEAAYRRALEIDPSNVLSFTGLGEVYNATGRASEAEDSYRQAIGLHPGNSAAYSALGQFYYRAGRYDEAAQQYQVVIALNPENMNGYSNLGTAYMLSGNFAAAAPAFQSALDIEPKKNTYGSLGLMHYYLGDFDAAIQSHRRAVELEPNDVLALSNLGDALWISGRKEEASKTFERAYQVALDAYSVNASDPYTLMDLSWITAMLGRQDESRAYIDRALEIAPDDPYSHYYNALICVRENQNGAALVALANAADLGYSRTMMSAEPHLASLRTRPKFQKIIASN